jgi:hypothetical protein
MTRTAIEGPAVIEYNGAQFYTEGTINLAAELAMHEIVSSYYGPIDRRLTDKVFNLTFTPVGMASITADKYYPYGIGDLGKLIAPETDAPVVIWTSAGEKLSFPAGVVSQCPPLNLGIGKMPMGQMGIACMGDLSKADAATDAHYTISTAAIAAHSLNPATILTPGYKLVLTLAGTPDVETTLDSEDGFVFDPGVALTPRKANAYGTVNYKLTKFAPRITFAPFGQTEAAMMALLNIQGATGAKLGASNRLGQSLTLTPRDDDGTGIVIEFPDCQVESGTMLFGATDARHGAWVFTPVLNVVDGAMQDLYTVTFPTFA